jgi:hypothetical protein
MRIYLSLSNVFYVRNLEPVLRLLLDQGHEIILGDGEPKDRGTYLESFLESVGTERVVVTTPPPRSSRSNKWVPLTIDYLFFLGREFEEAPYLRLKKGRKAREYARQVIRRYRLRYGWRRRAALAWLRLVEESIPVDAGILEHFRQYRPDILIVSPLIGSHLEQLEHVKAAKVLRIPTVFAVHSWDNLTSKGLIRMRPEAIAVWNDIQVKEAVELHRQPESHVFRAGGYNFDDWFVAKPSTDRTAFLNRVGLPLDRTVILYLCSALRFPEAQPEEDFIAEWLTKLRQCEDSRLREASVLVRPHPKRLHDFSACSAVHSDPAVAVWPRQGELPAGEERKQAFFDSLHHADSVVALNTTAMIDAAIVGRPVHTLLDDEHRISQGMTLHFTYLIDPDSGVLRVSSDWKTHFDQISESLASGHNAGRTRKFVEDFVRPDGLDRACAPRLADYIVSLARKKRIARLRGIWLRPIALPWLRMMARRIARAEEPANWNRGQSLEDWRRRRIFLNRLRTQASIDAA